MKSKVMPGWLWVATLLPRAVMLGLAWQNPSACLPPDASGYLSLANTLWHQHRFFSPDVPDLFRVPGYPLFLAPFTGLFNDPTLWIALVQSALGAWTVYLFWAWLNRIASTKGAAVGTLILALDAVTVFHTPQVLAETLALFICVLALRTTWRASHSRRTGDVVLGATLWGLAILIKPVFILLPVALLPIWWIKKSHLLIFLAAAYLWPGLWIMRNGMTANFWGLSTQAGFDLLKYPAASVQAMADQRPWASVQVDLKAEIDAGDPNGQRNWPEKSKAYHRKAFEILRTHPFLLARYCAMGTIHILAGTGVGVFLSFISDDKRSDPEWALPKQQVQMLLNKNRWTWPLQALYLVGLGLVYLLSITGCRALWKSGLRWEAYLLAIGALYLLAVASHQGYSRFRIPMMPFLAAAAAFSPLRWPGRRG